MMHSGLAQVYGSEAAFWCYLPGPVADCRVLLLSTCQVVPEERDAEEIAEKENVIEAGDQPAGHDVVEPVVLNPWCNHGNEIL